MLIIQNGILVEPDGTRPGDVALEDGVIVEVGDSIESIPKGKNGACETLDAAGCFVFPGFIDAHTHLDMDNGVTVTADDFNTGSAAAVVGGTTMLVDFATQIRGGALRDALKTWRQKAEGKAHCDYGFHMAITDWNERTRAELDEMTAAGVTTFKLYMAYDALRVDDGQLLDILGEMKRIRSLAGVHCENGTIVNTLVKKRLAMGDTGPAAHQRSRPPEAEAEAVSRLLYIARIADWPVCVVHLSCALGLEEIRRARAAGQKVLVETCPQYLLLDDSYYDLPGFEGAKYVCSPPLRSKRDAMILTQALRDGEIDTVATDHCSYRFHEQKKLGIGDFSKIPNGLPGVEHRPALLFSMVARGQLSLTRMCEALATAPAKAYGLYPRKGALRVGSDGDIVIWQPGNYGKVTAGAQRQNVDYTPFEGFDVLGRPREVLLRGRVVVDRGKLVQPREGRYVFRDKPILG